MKKLAFFAFLVCSCLLIVSTKRSNIRQRSVPKKINRIEIAGDHAEYVKKLLTQALIAKGYEVGSVMGDDINAACYLYSSEKENIVTFSVHVRGHDVTYHAYAPTTSSTSIPELILDVVLKLVTTLDGLKREYPDPVPRLGGDGSVFYMKFPRSHVAPGVNLPAAGSIMIAS